MKYIDFINHSIAKYPSLYCLGDFFACKIAIADHIFNTIGNGIEWARDENGKSLGYLCAPKYKKVSVDEDDHEYVRLPDEPYGQVGFQLDHRFLSENVYQLYKIDKKLKYMASIDTIDREPRIIFESEKASIQEIWSEFGEDIRPNSTHVLWQVNEKREFRPYPNFQKQYSAVWEDGSENIKDDWREGALEFYRYCEQYFLDESRNKDYHYRWSAETLNEVVETMKTKHGKDYAAGLRKDYEWPGYDETKTDEENINNLWETKTKKNALDFIHETIKRLSK